MERKHKWRRHTLLRDELVCDLCNEQRSGASVALDLQQQLQTQLTRAQQLEARVMEAATFAKTSLCDHCEADRIEGNCLPYQVEECREYQLFKMLDDALR